MKTPSDTSFPLKPGTGTALLLTMVWGLSSVLIQATPALSSDPWERVKEKNGISIYVNPTGKPKFPPLKAVTVIPQPIGVVLSALRNYDAYPAWQPFMKRFEPLRHFGNDQAIFYAVFDFPWPILNRDLVLKNTIEEISSSPLTLKIHLEDTDFPLPEQKKKYVRIAYYRSDIVIEKIETNKTRMTATLESHPGGQLPVIGVNWIMREAIYRALINLREMIGESAR